MDIGSIACEEASDHIYFCFSWPSNFGCLVTVGAGVR
jgi:hypothetical protein